MTNKIRWHEVPQSMDGFGAKVRTDLGKVWNVGWLAR
jgi:hypothetical protein